MVITRLNDTKNVVFIHSKFNYYIQQGMESTGWGSLHTKTWKKGGKTKVGGNFTLDIFIFVQN